MGLLTHLTPDSQSNLPEPCPVRILDRSSCGMKIEVRQPLRPSTMVRLDVDDCLMLGDVAWCTKEGDVYHAGLTLDQSLAHLGDVRRLMGALVGYERRPSLYETKTMKACGD